MPSLIRRLILDTSLEALFELSIIFGLDFLHVLLTLILHPLGVAHEALSKLLVLASGIRFPSLHPMPPKDVVITQQQLVGIGADESSLVVEMRDVPEDFLISSFDVGRLRSNGAAQVGHVHGRLINAFRCFRHGVAGNVVLPELIVGKSIGVEGRVIGWEVANSTEFILGSLKRLAQKA